ncbi:acyl-CoA reductase [Bosea sp. PAMC 26642]|uniref:acyl-CoA reductase n=1 Tax=Bosea sp. (strain PAMC 26642) TaxID=1792307 RepID=UPI00076FFFB9|nr:acyl-CoA reductase [Bosea sp. PAMC 26642]AMJ63227.1 acyl-CoA reductase [Bosea sp. PAMC 26642]
MNEVAGHLPGLSVGDVAWRTLSFGARGESVDVSVPMLTPEQGEALAARIRANARAYLATLSVTQIVAVIDEAIAQLLDRAHPLRRKAERLLPIVTGYDPEMVRLGLTGYLKTFRQPQLKRFLAEDFADPPILDEFQPRPKGGFAKAYGPELLLHVWAGNVPGLPLWSLISGLLVKAGTIGKLPSAEPLMAGWFAKLLAEIDPRLGECLAVIWWKGGDEAQERAWFAQADVIVAYGGNDALSAMRERVPVTTRFLPHGHKIGFGLVSRTALDTRKAGELARRAAHDVMSYDQQGCYSPQMLFVERGGRVSPREFAAYVAHELASISRKHPRGPLSIAEASGVALWRNAEELRVLAGARELLGDPADDWAVVCVDGPEALSPSALGRTIKIVAVDTLAEAVALVAPHRRFLQTAGVAAAPEELFHLANLLGQAGVTRIAAFGAMTSPEAGWHHDGRFNLLDLVTMTEIEQSAEAAAEGFAPYVD